MPLRKKVVPTPGARPKPVHVQSGKTVYLIGEATTEADLRTVVRAYEATLLAQGETLAHPKHYPQVPRANSQSPGEMERPDCWFVDYNTHRCVYTHRLGVYSMGNEMEVYDRPTPESTTRKVQVYIEAQCESHPRRNWCKNDYEADGYHFSLHVYVDGFYEPCKDLAGCPTLAGHLRAKAVAGEPVTTPASVLDTDPVRLWTAFFEAYPDAMDAVYCDRYLFQRTLTLCIDGEVARAFVAWVMKGQPLSRDEIWDRYIIGADGPLAYIVTLPFTEKHCPRALRNA